MNRYDESFWTDSYKKNLKEAAKIVASWDKWKQEAINDALSSNSEDYYSE